MTIRFEENVSPESAQLVCQWSNSLGKSFQEQWMGPMIPFPLTIQVLQDLEGIFSIFDGQEFVGLSRKSGKKTAIFILEDFLSILRNRGKA